MRQLKTGPTAMGAREFRENLVQAIAWCAPRADAANPEKCLRSLPDPLEDRDLFQSHGLLVYGVLRARELALGSQLGPVDVTAAGGRLVVYLPDDTTSSGGPALGSRGFFDVHECPPWDSWVGYFHDEVDGRTERYLVAWVPPQLVDLAQTGIDAAPERAIVWFDEIETGLRTALEIDGGTRNPVTKPRR